MCGIMGFVRTASRVTDMLPVVLKSLFQEISVRGIDAAGFAVQKGKEAQIARQGVSSEEMAESGEFQNAIIAPDILIGHSRHATHGSPRLNRNNHPFYTDNLKKILVHNGVVHDEVGGIKRKGFCDSEKLLRVIEKHGVMEGFIKISRLKHSSYAIMLLTPAEQSLWIYKNTNPCWFVNLRKEIGGTLFASTETIIRDALDAAGLDGYSEKFKVKSLSSRHLYCFKLGMRPYRVEMDNLSPESASAADWRKAPTGKQPV